MTRKTLVLSLIAVGFVVAATSAALDLTAKDPPISPSNSAPSAPLPAPTSPLPTGTAPSY